MLINYCLVVFYLIFVIAIIRTNPNRTWHPRWANSDKAGLLFLIGSYRKEILDAYLFFNLSEVREHTQAWMDEYNNNRPHEGLGNLTPMELSKSIRHKQQINQLVT